MPALATRASSLGRVRRAPSHIHRLEKEGFVLEGPSRTPIRKKTHPKPSGEKKRQKRQAVPDPDEELAQTVQGAFEYDEVMRDLASHFGGAVQPPEDALSHEDSLLLPQFDPNCTPRTMGSWSSAEDEKLVTIVRECGARNWSFIAKCMAGRTNKQCRERWHNHLNPRISKDKWTVDEDLVIHKSVSEIGHKWSEIAARLPGRTDNAVKNRYNGKLKSMSDAAIRKDCLRDTPTTEIMHELVRRNALAEEQRKPGRFSIGQIEALACRDGKTVSIMSGCRWSNDEHSQLSRAIPVGTPVGEINWFAASRAVPTRTSGACRRHWESYLRGGWKPAPSWQGPEPEPEPRPESEPEPQPEPQPEPVVEVDAAAAFVDAPTTHGAFFSTWHVDDPKQLALMAFEAYNEGSYGPTWSRSSVLVVGKPGLTFAFGARGEALPSPPPPTDVIARSESSPKTTLATAERWAWVMNKMASERKEGDETTATSEAPAPHAPRTPWRRRSEKSAWRYYRQKKPRCVDATNPKNATEKAYCAFATAALEQTVFV